MWTVGAGIGALAVGAWSLIRHHQLPRGPSRLHWGGEVFGHRGCIGVAGIPENTIAALEYARQHGASGIEIDIRLSKDGVLVVHHDAFLGKGIAGPSGTRVDSMSLSELRVLRYVNDATKEVQMATLEECIVFCREKKLKMLIEIKEFMRLDLCVTQLLELFKRYADYMYSETTVISFSPVALYRVRARDQRIAVCMLTSTDLIRNWIDSKAEQVPTFFHTFPRLSDALVTFAQLRVAPWVIGVSAVGPNYKMFVQPTTARKWNGRSILVYLWGFRSSSDCTEGMKGSGILLACDNDYNDFKRQSTDLTASSESS